MRVQAGVKRGFSRLSDRTGGGAALSVLSTVMIRGAEQGNVQIIAPVGTVGAYLEIWGSGGNGQNQNVPAPGGGGYAAAYVPISAGDPIIHNLKTNGNNTASTVTASGRTLSATGGLSSNGSNDIRFGGMGSGGDINLKGGDGGGYTDGEDGAGNPSSGGRFPTNGSGGGGAAGPGGGFGSGRSKNTNGRQSAGFPGGGGATTSTDGNVVTAGEASGLKITYFKAG